jgi:hypothetical protein
MDRWKNAAKMLQKHRLEKKNQGKKMRALF